MLFKYLPVLASFLILNLDRVSGEAETANGPVEFVWPEQRTWYAAWQNNSPCGRNDGTVGNRTDFPLDSGKVALVASGETWDVVVRIAYMDKPTTQSDFTTQILHTVSELEAGHQCYTTPDSPSDIEAGTNATIQLEYTSTYDGSGNETFYACADITFIKESDFTTSVSCFNATVTGPSTEGIASSVATSAATSTATASSSTTSDSSSSGSSGLSKSAVAGVAVGCIAGGLALVGLAVFLLIKKCSYNPRFRGRESVESVRLSTIDDKITLQKSSV
ncbi:uncharacterized protein EAE98_010727 [Botrytis deweyae]|uniref:Copper acquisition factor BIM1-like domain-containing protein n=1 Tax=Botrytis deweyae TaxID=2478750 RepID=A0ABQ7I8N6_9HELO|nr:uncharacterized protein EAE98_010727 [Botrytis deweyae]KAF7916427.1 hypothetical protein EAE98_010727 [Botrytis deweyae]